MNDTEEEGVYLEIGDRTPGDQVTYPDDDLAATIDADGVKFTHRDGRPYGAQPPAAVNTRCPRSRKPVADDSLTTYRGHTVGFCNPGCRDDFAAHSCERPQDRAYFDAAIDAVEGRGDGRWVRGARRTTGMSDLRTAGRAEGPASAGPKRPALPRRAAALGIW